MDTEQTKDEIFRLTQEYLKDPPAIIWGSGATIPYGLPSMDDLKNNLKPFIDIDKIEQNTNLEIIIDEIQDENKIAKIKKNIRDAILKKDLECLEKAIKDHNYFETIRKMIEKFHSAHPQKTDIITTNYDRVLEYVLSQRNYKYTDGFSGKILSIFDSDNCFKKTGMINLFKVHGSLNWVAYKKNIFFLPFKNKHKYLENVMVLPRNHKYKEVSEEPYRTLIAESDKIIKKAKSFFVVGFGFNDEHLTPKIETQINKNIPIVIVTKKATLSCDEKLKKANKYCLFEEHGNQTQVRFKKMDQKEKTYLLANNYWELKKFMEIL